MRGIRVASIGFVILKVHLSLAQIVPPVDQTQQLQAMIDSLPPNGVLDCGNQHYVVTSLQLKSNMIIQNCQLETLPGTVDFTSPITIDGRTQAEGNIVISNVHVKGNRHGQTDINHIKGEDGGRHCFRLMGHLSNIVIDGSSGSYCATDGIALMSYGVSQSDNPADLPIRHIVIRNSTFAFNRRHGVSADGVIDLTFNNVTFLHNGTTISGGAEGDLCASVDGGSDGLCYATGFWYEDYTTASGGEGLNGVVFSNCSFRDNYQRSIFFNTIGQPASPGYQPRTAVRILNSYLDSGLQPLAEDYALQFQVTDALVSGPAAFQNILIQNTVLDGSVGFRQLANVLLESSQINTSLPYLGYSAYSTNLAFRDVQASGKLLNAQYDPSGQNTPVVVYSTTDGNQFFANNPPTTGTNIKGDIVWNSQLNVAPTGWICLTTGTPCPQWQTF